MKQGDQIVISPTVYTYLPQKLRLSWTRPRGLLMKAPRGTTDTSASIWWTDTASLFSSVTVICNQEQTVTVTNISQKKKKQRNQWKTSLLHLSCLFTLCSVWLHVDSCLNSLHHRTLQKHWMEQENTSSCHSIRLLTKQHWSHLPLPSHLQAHFPFLACGSLDVHTQMTGLPWSDPL